MSSFTRRIQRTVKRDDEGNIKAARSHFGGRGSKLGVVNPKAKDLLKRQARDRKWGRKS